jgi:hypothetical protein
MTASMASCNAPNFAVEFFLFFTRQNSGVTLSFFFFPSLHLDLFQSSSGIRFGIPVRIKTLNTLCCLMHHAALAFFLKVQSHSSRRSDFENREVIFSFFFLSLSL